MNDDNLTIEEDDNIRQMKEKIDNDFEKSDYRQLSGDESENEQEDETKKTEEPVSGPEPMQIVHSDNDSDGERMFNSAIAGKAISVSN